MVTAVELVLQALRSVSWAPVSTKVPAARPDLFVRVEQAAPVAYSPSHDRAMIIVQVYGVDLEAVIHTIGVCRDTLRFDIQSTPGLLGWEEISGPVDFPDPDLADSWFRWQLVGTVFQALTPTG